LDRHINCLSVIPILKYVEARGFSAETLVSGLPVPLSYLQNPRNWLSSKVVVEIFNRCEKLFNDPLIMYKIGRDGLVHQTDAAFVSFFRLLIAPKLVFKYAGKIATFFTKFFRIEAESVGPNEALVYFTYPDKTMAHRHGCLYNMGWTVGLPIHIWKTRGWVWEEECVVQQELDSIRRLKSPKPMIDSVRFGSNRCVFRLRWVEPRYVSHINTFLDNHENLISQAINALEDKELSLQEKELELQRIEKERSSRDQKKREILQGFGLTPREQEVTWLVSLGKNNYEIAEELAISLETVKKHLNNIFHKMKVKSRTALIAKIYRSLTEEF